MAFQYRTDYYTYSNGETDSKGKKGKNLDLVGIGIHLKGGYAGFEMPVSFDYNMMKMVNDTEKPVKDDTGNPVLDENGKPKTTPIKSRKNVSGMLISLAPGYGYDLSKHVEWLDKVAVAVRFDFIKGVYLSKDSSYLDYSNYKKDSSYMRIGATANLFTKEIAGVRGMAGLTFLMQPKSTVVKDDKSTTEKNEKEEDHGFMTFVLQAGAEF